MSQLTLAISVLAFIAAAFALLVGMGNAARIGSIRHHVLPQLGGLPLGTTAPISLLKESLPQIDTAQVLLLFMSGGCEPCQKLTQILNVASAALETVTVVVVEGLGENSLRAQAKFRAHWILDSKGQLRDQFAAQATPHTYFLVDGVVTRQAIGADASVVEWIAAAATAVTV